MTEITLSVMVLKIGVAMNARNEGSNIGRTLDGLFSQTIKPYKVIVCNDGSSDSTKNIAESRGAIVLDFPEKHDNWILDPRLAETINMAIEPFDDDPVDYILLVGGDDILQNDYLEKITSYMSLDKNIKIASGESEQEHNVVPRGSGRMVDYDWWKSHGLRYPVNHGWESWLLARCKTDGYDYKIYHDVKSKPQRKLRSNYGPGFFRERGRAYKSLGYTKKYVFGRILVMVLRGGLLGSSIELLMGYSENVKLYDDDIRRYFERWQNEYMRVKNMSKLYKKFVHSSE